MKGKVYLVGAGPGDPELLTLKALRLLQSADAALHDDLVAPEILALLPSSAQILNVGKRAGQKKISQGEIDGLMVELASAGQLVVRLKSGDPLIFGRAGEEMEALRRNDIAFEIVPGVTAALGAAAAAQIPLTHRRTASALVLLTAHRAAEHAEGRTAGRVPDRDDSDWGKFAASGATLLIYMPGQNYSDIANRLTSAGLGGDTVCAIISRATTRQQRIYRTTVRYLDRAPLLPSPALLVVGEVARQEDHVAVAKLAARALPFERETRIPAELFPAFVPRARNRTGEGEARS